MTKYSLALFFAIAIIGLSGCKMYGPEPVSAKTQQVESPRYVPTSDTFEVFTEETPGRSVRRWTIPETTTIEDGKIHVKKNSFQIETVTCVDVTGATFQFDMFDENLVRSLSTVRLPIGHVFSLKGVKVYDARSETKTIHYQLISYSVEPKQE